ncbi:MAG TPA: hypothetical protein VG273_23595 [Bryobacteraceae bacterium]|jgi:hypothetical protein|nr:hypothetical protein [Bryobacteraceae bacterium]
MASRLDAIRIAFNPSQYSLSWVVIDHPPAGQITVALRYIHYLCADPVLLSLLNALPDDEPYTAERRERDAEAEASIAGGGGISHHDVLREFGL